MNSIVAVRGVSFELSNGRELFNNLNFSLARKLIALVGQMALARLQRVSMQVAGVWSSDSKHRKLEYPSLLSGVC